MSERPRTAAAAAAAMPSRFSIKQLVETGRRFISFLAENKWDGETDREVLRDLYNLFRSGQGTPVATFSSMLYGMRISNRARVTKENVIFRKKKNKINLPSRPAAGNRPLGIEQPEGRKAESLLKQIRKKRFDLITAKYGVVVEVLEKERVEVCDGQLRIRAQLHQEEKLTLQLQNRGTQPVILTRLFTLSRSSQISFQPLDDNELLPFVLHPNDSHRLRVHCRSDDVGHFPATVLWTLERPEEPGAEFIVRFLAFRAQSPLTRQLEPTAPYRRRQLPPDPPRKSKVEEGERPNRTAKSLLEKNLNLKWYDCSPLKRLVPALMKSDSSTDDPELTQIWSQLNTPLSWDNYEEKLKLLLQLEELQMEQDIKQYNLKDTTMSAEPQASSGSNLFTLKVPGVAENRPSVLRGDHLLITFSQNSRTFTYKGYVHKVELDQVKLSLHPSFPKESIAGLTFNVAFTLNRLPLRLQYRALELARKVSLEPVLFPAAPRRVPLISGDLKLTLHDRRLESNPQQVQAIRNIILDTSRPAPYLIFGPPGTGKTVTLVEAIKQVVKLMPDAHILACAPTNSAANLLCQRLLPHLSSGLYRLLAQSQDFHLVPEDIKDYCNWDEDSKDYEYPPKEKLQKYRVLITTLLTAGRLASAQFPRGHFSHIFIDEAGNTAEPESLIAVAGLLDVEDSDTPGGQLVLTGDPKQLGPVLHSQLARNHGLGMSLLERLVEKAPQYKQGPGYNSTLITKLLCNYRSHPSILEIPNRLFYQGELLPCADLMDRERFCRWEGLPRQGFPIVFHGVLGEDMREANSPSFFNAEEVHRVVEYLHELLCSQPKKGQGRLSPQHVGVISPFRKQVEKIRHCLTVLDKKLRDLNNIKDLKVGSVEEFQGQERYVIIISTVCSSHNFVQLDKDFTRGILNNPKRFNVAMTRAKALLIVVGNPILLSQDRQWKTFLQFCKDNGGYKGCPFPTDEEQGVCQQLNELSRIFPTQDNPATKDSISPLQEELAWKCEM